MITIKVNSRGVENKLKKLQAEVGKVAAKNTFAAATYARNVARQLVPTDTGDTKDAIAVIVKTNNKEQATAIVGFRGFVHMDRVGKHGIDGGKWFNLPYWMTKSKRAVTGFHPYGNPRLITHFNNGDPRFLIIARELAYEKFKKDVRIDLKNLVN